MEDQDQDIKEIVGFVNAVSQERGGIRVEQEWYNTHDESIKSKIAEINKGDYVKIGVADGKLISLVIDDKAGETERKAYDWKTSLAEKKKWLIECKSIVDDVVGTDKQCSKAELISTLFISLERRK